MALYDVKWGSIEQRVSAGTPREARALFCDSCGPEVQRHPNRNKFEISEVIAPPTVAPKAEEPKPKVKKKTGGK